MSEWKECKLGDFANINMGQSPESKYYNTNKVGLPFLQGNRTFGRKFPTFDTYCSYPKKVASHGDILFSVRAPVGDINLATEKICIGRGLASISAKNSQNNFLYFFMHFLKDSIVNTETGSVFGAVNKENLESLPILLPPLPEQKAIAEVLSSLDDKIDLLHRQNKTLEAMAEALFRKWFVEEADESWEEGSILELIDLVGGGTPKTEVQEYWDGDIPWLSGGDISNNHKSFATDSAKNISNLGLQNSSAKLLPENSIVISARGTVGKFCILSKPMAYSQSNYGIIPKGIKNYFFTYLLLNYAIAELKSSAYGSVFDTITTATFKELKLPIPTPEYTSKMEKLIEGNFIKIKHNCFQIRSLEKLRDTLLPKLMSGEVRVKL